MRWNATGDGKIPVDLLKNLQKDSSPWRRWPVHIYNRKIVSRLLWCNGDCSEETESKEVSRIVLKSYTTEKFTRILNRKLEQEMKEVQLPFRKQKKTEMPLHSLESVHKRFCTSLKNYAQVSLIEIRHFIELTEKNSWES